MTNKQQPLIPATWHLLTLRKAGEVIGVSEGTIRRYIKDGRLGVYTPMGCKGEKPQPLVFQPDVMDMAAARRKVKGQP